jgi:hypothetical protein
VASDPSGDLVLSPLDGEGRSIREWLTNFNLALFCIDPYTNESSWILDTAARIMGIMQGSAARMCWLVTGPADDARTFLGPLARDFLTFADPDRAVVKSLGLERLPALVVVRADGTVAGAAEGWHPNQWRAVVNELARMTAWTRPEIPGPRDPVPFEGSPALG